MRSSILWIRFFNNLADDLSFHRGCWWVATWWEHENYWPQEEHIQAFTRRIRCRWELGKHLWSCFWYWLGMPLKCVIIRFTWIYHSFFSPDFGSLSVSLCMPLKWCHYIFRYGHVLEDVSFTWILSLACSLYVPKMFSFIQIYPTLFPWFPPCECVGGWACAHASCLFGVEVYIWTTKKKKPQSRSCLILGGTVVFYLHNVMCLLSCFTEFTFSAIPFRIIPPLLSPYMWTFKGASVLWLVHCNRSSWCHSYIFTIVTSYNEKQFFDQLGWIISFVFLWIRDAKVSVLGK